MSSSAPSSPARRKSGSVGGGPSPERRRSSRLSSKSAQEKPEAEVEPAQADNDASATGGGSAREIPAEDDMSPSDDPIGNADDGHRPPTPLSTRFISWNLGEIPHTTSRVYSTDSEKEEDDNDGKQNDKDGKEDENQDRVDYKNDDEAEEIESGGDEKLHEDAQGRTLKKVVDPLPDFTGQDAARSSNAQAVPPIYEDRGIKFKPGTRHVDGPDETEIDQEQHLFLKLVDMRPKSKTDKTPKRQLIIWHNINGVPKDWSDKYAIKKLNAAHQDNIRTICHEFNWSQSEANFIAQQFNDNLEISIRELAYRFNNHFMYENYFASPQPWDIEHTGRTIESIRGEYLFNKDLYDNGKAPEKSEVRGKRFIHPNGLTDERAKENWKNSGKGGGTKPDTKNDKAPGKTNKDDDPNDSDDSENGDQKDDSSKIRSIEDYKKLTIAQLKQLAKDEKPDGFLKGLRKKGQIVEKFESDHSDPENLPDADEGNDDTDVDGDTVANTDTEGDADNDEDDDEDDDDDEPDDADDGDIIVPLYQKGENKGQPNYRSLKMPEIRQLATNRGIRMPDHFTRAIQPIRINRQDYIEQLLKQDERKGRYKKDSKPAPGKKRKLPGTNEEKSNKRQKTQDAEDAEEAVEDDVPIVSSSPSKRKSSTPSQTPISPRKASLRSSSSKSGSTVVDVVEETPVAEEEESQVVGEEEESQVVGEEEESQVVGEEEESQVVGEEEESQVVREEYSNEWNSYESTNAERGGSGESGESGESEKE